MIVNGKGRVLDALSSPVTLDVVLTTLELRADRVAVELNGELASRASWPQTEVQQGDRLEIVHFVGGGSALVLGGDQRLGSEPDGIQKAIYTLFVTPHVPVGLQSGDSGSPVVGEFVAKVG